jgi:hypothetical protein
MRIRLAHALVTFALAACSTSGDDAAPRAADPFDAGPYVAGPYASSACRACLATACAAPLARCAAEPSCAARVTCLDRCGLGPEGDVDPACAAACPAPAGAVATDALDALDRCHTAGEGTSCAACGLTPVDAGAPLPILAQRCTAPPEDAGGTCLDRHCCETTKACTSKADCVALFDCLGGCLGPSYAAIGACYHACEVAHPSGLEKGAPLLACATYFCSRELVAGAKDCVSCLFDRCPKEWFDCHASPACDQLHWCYVGCDKDTTCIEGCFTQHPSGRTAFGASLLCGSLQCPAKCSAGF